MKTNTTLHLLAATLLAVFTSPHCRAQIVSGNDAVRIEVRVQTGQERVAGKGREPDTVTQEKTLHLSLSGKARSAETRKGTWQAYARDVKDGALVAIDSGTFDIDLSKGAQKVDSAKISTTYKPEHAAGGGNRGGGGGGGGGGGAAKKVPGEGKKFIGFGITVKDGERVVGEYFDPAGLKADSKK